MPSFVTQKSSSKIIYDVRLTRNTIDLVQENGGVPLVCKSGHAFIKELMRKEDAIYGGEMSAHHYFKDFFYCDSGMIPLLLVLEIMSRTGRKLSDLVKERIRKYPVSGEINLRFRIRMEPSRCKSILKAGIRRSTPWMVSAWNSLTGAVIFASPTPSQSCANVESRQNEQLMQEKTREILQIIEAVLKKTKLSGWALLISPIPSTHLLQRLTLSTGFIPSDAIQIRASVSAL